MNHACLIDLLQSSTIREFDSRFTAKMFGYSSCDDYYHAATLHNKIHALKVPVLVLSAEDDPFSPSHGQWIKESINEHFSGDVYMHVFIGVKIFKGVASLCSSPVWK